MRLRSTNSISTGVRAAAKLGEIGARHYGWEEVGKGCQPCTIPVGADEGGLWLAGFDEHTLVCGQTGSGKTLSCLANTILLNASSKEKPALVVIDAKTTLFSLTSRQVSRLGYSVRHVSLLGEGEDGFNPLHAISEASANGQDLVADLLMDSLMESLQATVKSSKDAYWENTAATLIGGCVYGLLETVGNRVEPTLAAVSDLLSKGTKALEELRRIVHGKKAQRMLDNALAVAPVKDTFNCVLGVAQTMLAFYTSETGRRIAGKSTFDIEEALFGGMPTAVYITCPDGAGPGAKRLASLFFDTLYVLFARRAEANAADGCFGDKVRVVWDEWPAFPKSMVPESLSMSRSRGMSIMMGMQSTAQLMASGYTRAESQTMLAQFGKVIFFRSTDSMISEVAKERTAGLVAPSSLADLNPGEAIAVFGGKPVARTSLPLFDALVERKLFEKREEITDGRLWLAEDTSNFGYPTSTGTKSERNAVRYMFNRLARAPRLPECAESPWAEEFLTCANRSNSYSELTRRMEELGGSIATIGLTDARLCGSVLSSKLMELAVSSLAEAQLACRVLGDGTFPILPQLGDTLYLTALGILFEAEGDFARKDSLALCTQMVNGLIEPFNEAVGSLNVKNLEPLLPIGWGLSEYQQRAGSREEKGPITWQALAIEEALAYAGKVPQMTFVRATRYYEVMYEEGERVGSLLFNDTEEAAELKLWIALAGAFGPLFYPEACKRLKGILMDSMGNTVKPKKTPLAQRKQ